MYVYIYIYSWNTISGVLNGNADPPFEFLSMVLDVSPRLGCYDIVCSSCEQCLESLSHSVELAGL